MSRGYTPVSRPRATTSLHVRYRKPLLYRFSPNTVGQAHQYPGPHRLPREESFFTCRPIDSRRPSSASSGTPCSAHRPRWRTDHPAQTRARPPAEIVGGFWQTYSGHTGFDAGASTMPLCTNRDHPRLFSNHGPMQQPIGGSRLRRDDQSCHLNFLTHGQKPRHARWC